MLRIFRIFNKKCNQFHTVFIPKQTFLTSDYQCNDTWKTHLSPFLNKLNLNDFYNTLDQNYSSKGTISAIDVDIFANALKDSAHLDELRDLLLKLRFSAETGNMLDSTHQATIRNYIQYGDIQELLNILKDPLTFGLFLDEYTANILLDKLITSSDLEQAAQVASLVMLQEDYSNEITSALCQYACYQYIMNFTKPPEPEVVDDKKKKIEEVKIRVKFLRNPYYDDHFDIKDIFTLSGKTLAWISEKGSNNLNINLQILGWLSYQKYGKLLNLCEACVTYPTFKIYTEVYEFLKKETNLVANEEIKAKLETSLSLLSQANLANGSLNDAMKIMIENAINKGQNKDILQQKELFQSWAEVRQKKLNEQTYRLERAKRIEVINQKQIDLASEEQKLWFFENEESIDLQIEEKEKTISTSSKNKSDTIDDNYIPPVISPKRK